MLVVEYFRLHNLLVSTLVSQPDIVRTLPRGLARSEQQRKKRDRERQKNLARKISQLVSVEEAGSMRDLKKTIARSIAWGVVDRLQVLEGEGRIEYVLENGDDEEVMRIIDPDESWERIINSQLFENEVTVDDVDGFRVLSGNALLAAENILRSQLTRGLTPKFMPLRFVGKTCFDLYMHSGSGEMYALLYLLSDQDERCRPLLQKSREDNPLVSLVNGKSALPRTKCALLFPLESGLHEDSLIKCQEDDLIQPAAFVKKLKKGEKERQMSLYRQRLEMWSAPKTAELVRRDNGYFLHVACEVIEKSPRPIRTVLGLHFGIFRHPSRRLQDGRFNFATAMLVNLDGQELLSFSVRSVQYLSVVHDMQEKLTWLQSEGRWVGGTRYQRVLREYVHKMANTIIELAVEFNSAIVLEDLMPGPTKTGADRHLNRIRSFWCYGQLTELLTYKAQGEGLALGWSRERGTHPFTVSYWRANYSCSQCGETNVGKKEGERRLVEVVKWRMTCHSCGWSELVAANSARVVAQEGVHLLRRLKRI